MSPRGSLRPKSGGSFHERFASQSTPMRMRRPAKPQSDRSGSRTPTPYAGAREHVVSHALRDVEPERGDGRPLGPADAGPPPRLDLVAPADDVALDRGGQARRDGE